MNTTTNTNNRICAAYMAVPERPPKPNTAATNAIIKNINAQRNMIWSFPKTGMAAEVACPAPLLPLPNAQRMPESDRDENPRKMPFF